MASEEDPAAVYGVEDLDEEDDDESEEEDLTLINPPDDDDDDEEDSTSSSNLAAGDPPPPPSTACEVTIAVAGIPNGEPPQGIVDSLPDPKRQRVEDVAIVTVIEGKKPSAAFDDSRRLFQRLWTDEDEIELLQGFLDYTTLKGTNNSSHHHDTTAFYDQIKCKLQLDFNKNQLVEKLRRLKKKYRNVLSKTGTGKEFPFKSPHDQATFEISRKIWSGTGGRIGGAGVELAGLEDDEGNPSPNPNSMNDYNYNGVDVKTPRPRKRSRGVKMEEKHAFNQQSHHPPAAPIPTPVPNLIEETVRSCLSPLFKELLHSAMNGPSCGARGFGGVGLNSMPMGFGGGPLNFSSAEMVGERWKKQKILELEVYSKRIELVQDQIKSALDHLRSVRN